MQDFAPVSARHEKKTHGFQATVSVYSIRKVDTTRAKIGRKLVRLANKLSRQGLHKQFGL